MTTETPTKQQLLERELSATLFLQALDLLEAANELIDDPEYKRRYRIFLRAVMEFIKEES